MVEIETVNVSGEVVKLRMARRLPILQAYFTAAYWIDGLVRSGQVADLAEVARMCGVSRARVSKVVGMMGVTAAEQEKLIDVCNPLND